MNHTKTPFALALALLFSASVRATDGGAPDTTAALRDLDRHCAVLPAMAADLQAVKAQLQQLLHSRWEYLLLPRNRFKESGEQLDELGRQGWELVSSSPEEGFLLKRRLAPGP